MGINFRTTATLCFGITAFAAVGCESVTKVTDVSGRSGEPLVSIDVTGLSNVGMDQPAPAPSLAAPGLVPGMVNLTKNSQAIVATIYSEWDHATNSNVCLTASDPKAAAAGYWDLGGYSTCDASGIPQCVGGSKKIILSQSEAETSGRTKMHTACILPNNNTGFQFVATIYSQTDLKTGVNTCATAKDPTAAAAGYWDLGQYSYCDSQGIPRCTGDSKKLVMAASQVPGSSVIKYHTVCVRNSAEKKTRIVATIYSEFDSVANKDTCIDPIDPLAANVGYWDIGSNGGYAYCDTRGIPQCTNGAKKVIMSATVAGDQKKIKYHTACVLPTEAEGSEFVATVYSEESVNTNTCTTTSNANAQKAGYWDLGQYASCNAQNIPVCGDGSKKLIMSDTAIPGGLVKYHTACIKP